MQFLWRDLEEKIDTLNLQKKDLFIWGTGNTSMLYEPCFRAEKILPVAFVDNDASKIGGNFLGRPVISPDKLSNDAAVLICSQSEYTVKAIKKQLQTLHIPYCTVNEFVFRYHINDITECCDILEDERSKDVYSSLIHGWIDSVYPPPGQMSTGNQYFSHEKFSVPDVGEVFVDVGAFVGDSLEKYLFCHGGTFKKIYAFEPDEQNFAALNFRTNRLKKEWAINEEQIELVQAGIGKNTTEMNIQKEGLMSKISSTGTFGESKCRVYRLDDYFSQEHVGFLKADIEGFEYDMLTSGERVIRRDLPKLAVCIYHNASDMFRIMLWLKKLGVGYKFAIRHYSSTFAETVLYAWVEK